MYTLSGSRLSLHWPSTQRRLSSMMASQEMAVTTQVTMAGGELVPWEDKRQHVSALVSLSSNRTRIRKSEEIHHTQTSHKILHGGGEDSGIIKPKAQTFGGLVHQLYPPEMVREQVQEMKERLAQEKALSTGQKRGGVIQGEYRWHRTVGGYGSKCSDISSRNSVFGGSSEETLGRDAVFSIEETVVKAQERETRTDWDHPDKLPDDGEDVMMQEQFPWPVDFSLGSSRVNMSRTDLVNVEGIEGRPQEKDNKKLGPNLERIAYQLSQDLINIFLKKQHWDMYHPNMVLEDNIRGKRYEGLIDYIRVVNIMKLTAHLRFVYVRFHILKITKHPEDNTIRIRWRIAGLGMARMLLRYFPDRLWMQGMMDKSAPSWYDGYSVFHVGQDDKVFKHVVDQVMRDEDPFLDSLVEHLKKRLKTATNPTPTAAA